MVEPGKVYLIGAGPGDPGLITRRGAELISKCEVVVYDFLANPELLALARPEAEVIYVGKKGGDHTLPQGGINQLLVDKAQEGKSVARLKGGDPFIFGRGGEEAEELIAAGIGYEVVPGVTSAVAAPAYAGIPLTHRSFVSCVTLATGHEDPTKEQSSLNWEAMVKTGGTLVLLMGMKKLRANCAALMAAGMDPATPAALVRWGTMPHQRVLRSTVAEIADAAETESFGPPSIFVVGGVVGLRDSLAWLERRPLYGLRVLITRTRDSASKLAAMISELGGEPVLFPTIRIAPPQDFEPLDRAVASLERYDWLIFTSVNGVKYFFERLFTSGRDARDLGGLKIAAIGPATAQAVADLHLKADLVPEKFVAEAAVEALAEEARAGRAFLLPRAEQARNVLPDELTALGGRVEVVSAYRTLLPEAADLAELADRLDRGGLDLALFTASSTVKNLAKLFPDRPLAEVLGDCRVGSIGPITSQTARELGLKVDIEAGEYTLAGLVAAVTAWRAAKEI